MDDSGILPLACIPVIHGGHAAVEQAMDGLPKVGALRRSVPSQVNQSSTHSCSIALIRATPLSFSLDFSSHPNGSFRKPDKTTQQCEEPFIQLY